MGNIKDNVYIYLGGIEWAITKSFWFKFTIYFCWFLFKKNKI